VKQSLRNFHELEKALAEELPKATAKNVLRRSMIDAMGKVEARAKQLAPVDKENGGALRDSITTKAARAKRSSRNRYETASGITVLTGPTGRQEGGNAAWQEDGTVNMPANPYMRPAADSEGPNVMDDVIAALTENIEKATARIARKAAKGK
jgi:HK97 gp10 family phage protein